MLEAATVAWKLKEEEEVEVEFFFLLFFDGKSDDG